MIENLNGMIETVNYKEDTHLRLYDNLKAENYPAHWHTPIEIIMPVENDYYVTIGNSTTTIRPGDIAIICPGVIHILKAPSHGRRIIFQANTSILNAIYEINSVISFMNPFIVITPEEYPDIHETLKSIIWEIKDEYFQSGGLMEASIYSKLISFFVIIGRNRIQKINDETSFTNGSRKNSGKLMHICEYIGEHYTEDLTLDQLAEMANFSKYHFTRLFKQFTGVPFYKYVNQKRIAYAETLLIDPDITITEVAIQSGFSSSSSFIRMFKIITNCTPTEFRRIHKSI